MNSATSKPHAPSGLRIDLRPTRMAPQRTQRVLEDFSEYLTPTHRLSAQQPQHALSPSFGNAGETTMVTTLPTTKDLSPTDTSTISKPVGRPGKTEHFGRPTAPPWGAMAAPPMQQDIERNSPALPPKRGIKTSTKIWLGLGGLLAVGAVGGGVAGGLAAGHHANSSNDGSTLGVSVGTTTTSAPSPSAARTTTLAATTSARSMTSSSAAAATSTPAAAAPWGMGGYTVTYTKQLDTCGGYDITCNNQFSDTWYVDVLSNNYVITAQQNTSQYTVDTQGGSRVIAFTLNNSTIANSDGCSFDRSNAYSLNVGANSASGTNTYVFGYNLDLRCIETTGNTFGQGANCQCKYGISATAQS